MLLSFYRLLLISSFPLFSWGMYEGFKISQNVARIPDDETKMRILEICHVLIKMLSKLINHPPDHFFLSKF